MRLDLYQTETERLAREQATMLTEARMKLHEKQRLTALEQAGALHPLQILIENAIGKAKHILKAAGKPVPVSAYDAFASLNRMGALSEEECSQWNRIVHDA